MCVGVRVCLALKKGHDINIGAHKVGPKKPHKLTRGATNKTKRNETKEDSETAGKCWGKTKIVLSVLEPKIIFERETPLPLTPYLSHIGKVVLYSCFVRVVQHVKSSGHTGKAAAPSMCVCVCVCLVERLVQDF